MRERIVVGLSGGVDSSVAAALLVAEGHEVIGVTLRVWPWREPEDAARRFGSCCSPETVDDARAVARRLGIPYYLLNTEREFDATVIEPFAQAYASGHTPVPCVACNRHVKFGSLLARARAWGATAVATGHYARLDTDATTGRRLLYRAADPRKDQSDFLWPLTQDQLASALGLSRSSVANAVRVLDLPDDMQSSLVRGHITPGHAKVLLSVEDEREQRLLYEKIAEEKLSVRELEGTVDQKKLDAPTKRKRRQPDKKPHIASLEERFRESLGTRVRIHEKGGKGSIIIEFYTSEDFERIREHILGK